MAVVYNKGPRTAKDLIEDKKKRLYESKKKQRRVHVNKYAKRHQEEVAEREKGKHHSTPGASEYLRDIVNRVYGLDEIERFDIFEAIDDNPLSKKAGHVRSKLAYKYIMQNDYLSTKYLLPGQICCFTYNDPKTKDELEYWDKTPLTLFFGVFKTAEGNIREIGLNLHYFPPFTRKKVLDRVYNMFKSYFEKNFNEPSDKPNTLIDYQTLKHVLKRDSKIAFAVKEYVPSLRGLTYVIPAKMLPIAFYTEGHFSRATIQQVHAFWRQFSRF
jgi:hypothetical protein